MSARIKQFELKREDIFYIAKIFQEKARIRMKNSLTRKNGTVPTV